MPKIPWDKYLSVERYYQLNSDLTEKYKEPKDDFDKIQVVKRAVLFLPFYLKFIRDINSYEELCDQLNDVFFSLNSDKDIEPISTMKRSLRNMHHRQLIDFVSKACYYYKNEYEDKLPFAMMDSSDYFKVSYYLISQLHKRSE